MLLLYCNFSVHRAPIAHTGLHTTALGVGLYFYYLVYDYPLIVLYHVGFEQFVQFYLFHLNGAIVGFELEHHGEGAIGIGQLAKGIERGICLCYL